MSFGGAWRQPTCCDRGSSLKFSNPPFLKLYVEGYPYSPKPTFSQPDGADVQILSSVMDFNRLMYTYSLAVPRQSNPCNVKLLMYTREDILPKVYDAHSHQELIVKRVLRRQDTTVWYISGCMV